MVNRMRHTPKGYIRVGTPRAARCFRMSRSVPYQLKPFVAYPIRGRCTVAEEGTETIKNRRNTFEQPICNGDLTSPQKKSVERWKLVIIFRCNHTCTDSLFCCTDTYHSFSWLLNKSSSGPFPKLTA